MDFRTPQATIFLVVLASVFVAECLSADNTTLAPTVTVTIKADADVNPVSGKGNLLKCYVCNSFVDKACNNPAQGEFVETCKEGQNLCRKIEQKMKGETRIHRQCATKGKTGDCLERTGTHEFKTWYCECKGDLCNGASLTSLSASLSAVAAAVFMLRKLIL